MHDQGSSNINYSTIQHRSFQLWCLPALTGTSFLYCAKIQPIIFYSNIVSFLMTSSRNPAGGIREFKIPRLRTTATVKHATAHDLNHVTVHFSRVVLRLRWVVELFHVVGTTENILLVFCRLGNSRISSFRKKVFNSPALGERVAKYVGFVQFLLRFTLLIHCCDYIFI